MPLSGIGPLQVGNSMFRKQQSRASDGRAGGRPVVRSHRALEALRETGRQEMLLSKVVISTYLHCKRCSETQLSEEKGWGTR